MSCILDSNHPEEFEQEFTDDSDFSERESDASQSVVDSDEQSVDVGEDFVHRDLRSSRMMYCGECKIRSTTVIMTRSYTEDYFLLSEGCLGRIISQDVEDEADDWSPREEEYFEDEHENDDSEASLSDSHEQSGANIEEKELDLEDARFDKFRLPEETDETEDEISDLEAKLKHQLRINSMTDDEFAFHVFNSATEEQLRLVKEDKTVNFVEDQDFLTFWSENGQFLTRKNIEFKGLGINQQEFDNIEEIPSERKKYICEIWNWSSEEVFYSAQLYWSFRLNIEKHS